MRGIARIAVLGIAGLATWPATSQEMKVVETDGLEIIFQSPAADYLIPYTIQTFENGLAAQRRLFDYVPDGKPALMLRDFTDRGNAMIATAPRNRIYYDVAPMNLVFETFSPGERMYTIANHETVHLVTSDQAGPTEKRARRWFGGKVGPVAEHPETLLYYYLTTPRNATPRWYSEGSATFMETWYGGGLGRAQGGYDEMVFRAMVRDGARFYDPLGLVSEGTEVDFQTGANAYLYGTRFMSYLALKYTPEKLIEWWRLDEGSQRYYERDFEQVFGLPLPQAWQDWIAWEHEFQRANLASVRQHPITPYREITRKGLGAISQSYLSSDRRELYAAVRYPGRVPYLVAIRLDDGSVRELVEIKSAMAYRVTSLAYDPASETLFYTEDNGSLRDLMAYDIKTDKSRLLIEDGRIGDLSFNRADGSLWGLRTNNGFVMIVRMAPPYTEWKALHVYPFGEVPFDLDVSRDGKLVSLSLAGPDGERSGMQVMQVRVMSSEKLLAGDATPLHRFEMGTALPESFTFSDDGRYLFGSSYYTGVSNIYRYDLEQRKLEALSNAESGFFRPLPLDQDEMIVFHYAADGFVPAIIEPRPTEDLSAITFLGEQVATQRPVVQGWGAGPPSQVDYVAATLREETYSPWRKLSRESVYPVVEGYKDSVGFGAHARFSDPIGFQSLALTASYSPDSDLESKERLHASIDFRHYLWKAGVRWNAGDFYDLFGPTKRSREGWSVYVENEKPLVYDPPETLSIVTKLAYFGDLDSLPNFQNVPSPTDRLGEASVALHYRHPRASVGHVDDEAGYLWSVGAHLYETEGEFTPSLLARFDAGLPLPLGHSSLWLRTAGGVASGDIDDPLANAYFGGFRNNYVDNGEPKRYREPLSMPGFEIDALNGRSFGKAMLEWNLPPLRFDGLGSPGFFGKWLRPAVFATGLVTNPDRDEERVEAYNVGLQFDLNLQVLHRLPMMLSVGYARGFEGDGQGEDEFMLSLKVL